MRPRIFISAGELSGDIVGARLVAAIHERAPDALVFGTGGSRMRDAGALIDLDTRDIGVVGVTEVARTLPAVAGALWRIRQRVREVRPHAAVLIGNDAFNVLLARWLRRQGVPTVSYFPPQVWLWRALLGVIARSFDAIVASFPEEQAAYARAAANASAVTFVGHYLASELDTTTDEERREARRSLGIDDDARVIGLLPGSRRDEIEWLAPVLIGAARKLAGRDPGVRFLVPTTEQTHERVSALIAECTPEDLRVHVARDSHRVLRAADLVLLASGTASLECALVGTPMVIVYKVSALTNLTARAAIWLKLIEKYEIGLPNLILGSGTVPEVLQERATAANVADEAWRLLGDPARLAAMRGALARIAPLLRGSQPIADTAAVVLQCAERGRQEATSPLAWRQTQRALGAAEPE